MDFAMRNFSVLLIISAIMSCEVIENEEVPKTDLEDVAIQIIHGGTFQYSEKGDVRNVLKAGRLERWKDDGFENEVSNKLAGIEGKGRLKHFLNKPVKLDNNLLKPLFNNSNFKVGPYVRGVCMIRKGKTLMEF